MSEEQGEPPELSDLEGKKIDGIKEIDEEVPDWEEEPEQVEEEEDGSNESVPVFDAERRLRRSGGQRAVLVVNVIAIAASLLAAVVLSYGHIRASSVNRIALDNQLAAPSGEPGTRVLNILLVGSDSAANLDDEDPIRNDRNGERLGDVVIIAHLDERSGEVALLSLPRDLWLPIGGSTRSGRINTTFALGGPALLIRTIEENFAIPIHHYVNVDFAGFKGLVEAVGSVDIYFDTPARDWNASSGRSQTGFEVTRPGCTSLDPDEALAYVRSRFYQTQDSDGNWRTDPSSDLGRIQRQQDFLGQLLARAIEMGARNPVVLRDLIDAGLENVTIDQDLTPQTLLDLGRTFATFEPGQLNTYSLPVTEATVSGSSVLIPVEDSIEPVLRLFVGNRFDEPVTIGVTMDADDEAVPRAIELHETLDDAGFELRPERSRNLGTESEIDDDSDDFDQSAVQVTLYHPSSERLVADAVLAAVGGDVEDIIVQVDESLPARNTKIVVSMNPDPDTNADPDSDLAFVDDEEAEARQGDPATARSSESEDESQISTPIVGGSCG